MFCYVSDLDHFPKNFKQRTSVAPWWFQIFFWLSFTHRVKLSIRLTSFPCLWRMFCFNCQRVHPQSTADYGYYAFCDVAHSLLSSSEDHEEQHVAVSGKRSTWLPIFRSLLPLMMSKFLLVAECWWFLRKPLAFAWRKSKGGVCRKFLEDFVNCLLSTV